MSEYICPKYKIRIDPDSHKTQGLQAGDIVRRQYVARDRSVYSLMAVLESGVDVISVQRRITGFCAFDESL